jgi:ABC-type lipoprotein export system ATPase subunit
MSNPQLEVSNLRKHYDDGRIEALRGVSLTIQAGEYIAISGASGSGKSTLLQLLGGLDTATSGEVLFEARPSAPPSISTNTAPIASASSSRPFTCFPPCAPSIMCRFPCSAYQEPGKPRRASRVPAASKWAFNTASTSIPNELSAGERQRVAIARALANNPSILLADEPTGNLDSVNSARIMEMLTGIQERHGMTLIIVTHENDIAHAAPRHIRIRDGRIEA